MSVIYFLIPIAIVLVVIAIAIFFWAVKSEQFDDLDRQGYSILFDEKEPTHNQEKTEKNTQTSEINTDKTKNKATQPDKLS